MTYEEKSEIVIRQLREDRDRLLNAIDNIRAEIEQYNQNPRNYPVGMISIAVVLQKLDAIKDLEQESPLDKPHIKGDIKTDKETDDNTRPYYANEWSPEDSLYVEQGMLYG